MTESGNRAEMFRPFELKMSAANIPALTIATFKRYYDQLVSGETGMISEKDLVPLETLPFLDDLEKYRHTGETAMRSAVVIKLNGGLGTSMGMARAKSLVEVKSGYSFLDIISRQLLRQREEYGAAIPLLLMNSAMTREDSLKALSPYENLPVEGLPLDFLQNRVPKVQQSNFMPARVPEQPELEWNPPGHGDIYNALVISGCLDRLLEKGFKYAFVSNADNLGAELDPVILGYISDRRLSFLMEVAQRTEADRKGGHLAMHRDGRLLLREIAQCDDDDKPFFFDIERHRFFNTNSIWVDLEQLKRILEANDYMLDLPLIRNAKTVNPRDPESTPVYQVETAMGAAISRFPNAGAICVPRRRFLPVKTTSDLIGLWSDAYVLTPDWRIKLHPSRSRGVITVLDSRYYKLIDDMKARFPSGAPSLLQCDRWEVRGDIRFGHGISIRGNADIVNTNIRQASVPHGATLSGTIDLSDATDATD